MVVVGWRWGGTGGKFVELYVVSGLCWVAVIELREWVFVRVDVDSYGRIRCSWLRRRVLVRACGEIDGVGEFQEAGVVQVEVVEIFSSSSLFFRVFGHMGAVVAIW